MEIIAFLVLIGGALLALFTILAIVAELML